MPSDTFFRLPEEKRERLVEAAWEEFAAESYADVSINKIIRKAGIPRGSFYQYFTDKEDLFVYLLDQVKEHILKKTYPAIVETEGGLFEVALRLFEELLEQDVLTDTIMKRYIAVMDINPRLDLRQFCIIMPHDLIAQVIGRTDLSVFREQNMEYLRLVVEMVIVALMEAIIQTMLHPEQAQEEQNILGQRIGIIRNGCCRDIMSQTGGTPC